MFCLKIIVSAVWLCCCCFRGYCYCCSLAAKRFICLWLLFQTVPRKPTQTHIGSIASLGFVSLTIVYLLLNRIWINFFASICKRIKWKWHSEITQVWFFSLVSRIIRFDITFSKHLVIDTVLRFFFKKRERGREQSLPHGRSRIRAC